MARPNATLGPKHWKALELWEEGILSIKEISVACKIPTDSMYDLFEGNVNKAGEIAHLFKAELDKITQRSAAKVRHLVKDNKKIALGLMNDRLKILQSSQERTEAESKELVSIINALNKATPGVEIGSFHSLSITSGMTPEELVYEFRRLSAIARNPSVGRGVSGTVEGTEDGLPGAPEPRSSAEEE